MAQFQHLKVLVIGAGIGGLAAAIALRQQGHEVEIFEKSRLASEVGAAVHMAPNCTVLLNRMGIRPETFGAVKFRTIQFRNKEAVTMFTHTHEHPDQFPADYFLVHRIDLHSALKTTALASSGPGTPATLHTASPVTAIDTAAATITLADGRTVSGDLVVGADGIHSRARASVAGREVPVFTSGKVGFRWLMAAELLRGDPVTRFFAEDEGGCTQVAGEDRRIVFYPCSNGEVMNCIAFVPVEEVGAIQKGLSGYDQAANKGKLVKHFAGFGDAVIRMLEKAPDGGVMLWDMLDMEVLPTWIKDRTVLLGDAAHPFLPYMGQGAAQAIEDGVALGALLPAGTSVEEIPERLRLWEQCRKERADFIQQVTRIRGRDASGKQGPPQTIDEFNAAFKYALTHDAWEHAKNALNAAEKPATAVL